MVERDYQLKKKIGQMLMVGFYGVSPSNEVIKLIKDDFIGGVILFGRNLGMPKEVFRLTRELQRVAQDAEHSYPLLIATDQENGIVHRLGPEGTIFPGNMLLGAANDVKGTYDVASATARELKSLGINMNLAPVLDVNNNPYNPVIGVRSFGESAEFVSIHGIKAIEAHKKEGIIATGKHFPGHGDTNIDSHLGLPVIPHALRRLEEIELVPFRKAIDKGIDAIMTAHIYLPYFEKEDHIPATASKEIIDKLLREKMGYKGVIITDCMEMNAFSQTVGTVDGAVKAINAGVDILLVSHSYELQKQIIERIIGAVRSGEINETKIDSAVKRIVKLKEKYFNWETVNWLKYGSFNMVGRTEHKKIAKEQYQKGITMLKNDGIIPLTIKKQDKLLVILPKSQAYTMIEAKEVKEISILKYLQSYHQQAKEIYYHNPPSKEDIDKVVEESLRYDIIMIGVLNANLISSQQELINKIIATGKPVIGLGLRNPYDLSVMQEINAFLSTYEYTTPALEIAIDILFGIWKAEGKLPVSIPDICPNTFLI